MFDKVVVGKVAVGKVIIANLMALLIGKITNAYDCLSFTTLTYFEKYFSLAIIVLVNKPESELNKIVNYQLDCLF